jgi:AcrR family transcriptional regulator
MPPDKHDRRPGSRGPREERGVTVTQIQAAARASFAKNGWAGTVHYYFSSKEELLDAVTTFPAEWVASIQTAHSVPLAQRGEAIVRNVVWTWSQPEIREALVSILLTAAHDPRTHEKVRAVITTSLQPAVADRITGEERLLRAALIGSQVLGLVMHRYVWEIEPLASIPDDDLVAVIGPTIQRYLSGRLG